MVRIVYGVAGEGSGHASRAREVLAHLLARGHEVKVASYDRGYRDLKDDFDVLEIEGLRIASADNQVSVVRTFTDNLTRLSGGVRKLWEMRERLFTDFRPAVVITDFEPMAAYLAHREDLPLVTIDNQHLMRYVSHPRPARLRKDALVTETIIRAIVPRPDGKRHATPAPCAGGPGMGQRTPTCPDRAGGVATYELASRATSSAST
ncbi:MAG: glycosyltransferase family protein [Planctomycetota bacterium]